MSSLATGISPRIALLRKSRRFNVMSNNDPNGPLLIELLTYAIELMLAQIGS